MYFFALVIPFKHILLGMPTTHTDSSCRKCFVKMDSGIMNYTYILCFAFIICFLCCDVYLLLGNTVFVSSSLFNFVSETIDS